MENSKWVSAGEVGQVGTTKMPFCAPFEVTEKTPKGQLYTIETWNAMRQCLIENGLMEPK